MVVADLLEIAPQHKYVICEGDIDIDQIIPIATHTVTISNYGTAYDFFARPDQQYMLDEIQNRTDLSGEEKAERVKNAYDIVGDAAKQEIPYETLKYGVKQIIRYDSSTIEGTSSLVAHHFGFDR